MTLHTDLETSLLRRFANHGREVRGGEGECTYWYEGEGDGGVWVDGRMG